jgi:hypothetical protein
MVMIESIPVLTLLNHMNNLFLNFGAPPCILFIYLCNFLSNFCNFLKKLPVGRVKHSEEDVSDGENVDDDGECQHRDEEG